MIKKLQTMNVVGLVFLFNAFVFVGLDISVASVQFQGIWASLFSAGLALMIVAKIGLRNHKSSRVKED